MKPVRENMFRVPTKETCPDHFRPFRSRFAGLFRFPAPPQNAPVRKNRGSEHGTFAESPQEDPRIPQEDPRAGVLGSPGGVWGSFGEPQGAPGCLMRGAKTCHFRMTGFGGSIGPKRDPEVLDLPPEPPQKTHRRSLVTPGSPQEVPRRPQEDPWGAS